MKVYSTFRIQPSLLAALIFLPEANAFFGRWRLYPSTDDNWSIEMAYNNHVGWYDRYFTFGPAVRRWNRIIVDDVSDRTVPTSVRPTPCGPYPQTIDDLYVCAAYTPVDGPGGVIGAAGATLARSDEGWLPYAGVVILDEADVNSLRASDNFDKQVLQDLGHVIGISHSILNLAGIVGSAAADPPCVYLGEHANAEWQEMSQCPGAQLPVETSFPEQAGIHCSHWSEHCLQDELMTGVVSGRRAPLSRISIAALEDLGYSVRYDWADPFSTADLNPECVCGDDESHDMRGLLSVENERKSFRRLSAQGQDAATQWGRNYLRNMAEPEEGRPDDYVGDSGVFVLYQEDDVVHVVPVTL